MNSTLRRFVSDSRGRMVIAQRPNAPIIGWAVLLGASALVDEPMKPALRFVSHAFLFTWGYLELTQGDSPFRRTLGGGVLAYLVASRVLPAL
jgi:hypothetical protein